MLVDEIVPGVDKRTPVLGMAPILTHVEARMLRWTRKSIDLATRHYLHARSLKSLDLPPNIHNLVFVIVLSIFTLIYCLVHDNVDRRYGGLAFSPRRFLVLLGRTASRRNAGLCIATIMIIDDDAVRCDYVVKSDSSALVLFFLLCPAVLVFGQHLAVTIFINLKLHGPHHNLACVDSPLM